MKNLLIYTSPTKKFSEEDLILARIQIDNSFDLGWKKQDLILMTDFPFEYNGIRSQVVPDNLYYDFDQNSNKTIVTAYLLNQGIIKTNELYWSHDFDTYESDKIKEAELGLQSCDLGLTHYCYKPEWQFGSIFFKHSAKDIFNLLNKTVRSKVVSSRFDERAMTLLTNNGTIDPKRYKRLNSTYNFTKRHIAIIYKMAAKPLKVLHFRPSNQDVLMPDTGLNMFMYGKNQLNIPLMSDRLIKIFHYHGIK